MADFASRSVSLPLLVSGLLAGTFASSTVLAKDPAPTPCDKLKPEQTVSAEEKRKVDAAIKVALGFQSGGGAVSSGAESRSVNAVLPPDDLARAFALYQVCVMQNEARLIDEATAQELTRKLFGLKTEAPKAVPTASATPAPAAKVAAAPAAKVAAAPAASVAPAMGALQIKAPYKGAEVFVDGKPYGPVGAGGASLSLPPGQYEVQVRFRGKKTVTRTVNLGIGGQEVVEVATMEAGSGWKTWLIAGAAMVGALVVLVGVVAVYSSF
jgi:hypothetical protein